MKRWGRPAEPTEPPRPATPPVAAGAAQPSPGLPSAGFGAALKSLVGRKLRELRGRRWERASQRAREAEAARRGAAEMARRIERKTGHRPAESTIRRAGRENRTPRGVDQGQLDRQSRIDAAGGLKPFARQAGVSGRAAPRWRDQGTPMAGGRGVRVSADVGGMLCANGERYPRAMTVSVEFGGPGADDLRAAYAAGDMVAVAELLGQPITSQTDWAGEADRYFQVTEIDNFHMT